MASINKRRWFWLLPVLVAVIIVAAGFWWWSHRPHRLIPDRLERELPESCRQILLVLTERDTAIPGTLWRMERAGPGEPWRTVGESIPVSVGRSGLAWGLGEHRASTPQGFRTKQEGDGCSPAGVFRIPYAFGYAAVAQGLKLPYLPVTATLMGVDDPASKFYNQVVPADTVAKDWNSHETMLRPDGLYRWGAFVTHNPNQIPGAGSCIFLHLWSGPGQPTSGCTAMAEESLITVLEWLNPALEPRLVQGLSTW